MAEAPKRVHDPPTGETPGKKPQKRRSSTSGRFLKKSLFQSDSELQKDVEKKDHEVHTMWNDEEVSALVEYIALYHSPDEDSSNIWPAGKNDEFWGKCADAVNCKNIGNKRSGTACRGIVRRYLKEKFPTIAAAEEPYGICYFGEKVSSHDGQSIPSSPPVVSGHATSTRSTLLGFSPLRDVPDLTKLPGCILDVISSGFSKLTPRQREQLLVHLFRNWLEEDVNPHLDATFVPQHFLPLVAKAMAVLHAGNKDNLIYYAARCFGEQRHGNGIPRMPLDRMPFGLIAHNLKFFCIRQCYQPSSSR